MKLFGKVKAVLKPQKGNEPSGSKAPGVGGAEHGPSTSLEVKSTHLDKALGISILSPGVSPIVDIVFLHGLTGHREETWTAEDATEPWPKLLLTSDIPNARIIAYGYDADVVRWTRPVGQNTVREHAQNLVNDLCDLRSGTKTSKRPILFVVHSLGGLVCQDALLLCVNPSDEAQGTLLSSTRGVAFMGTPNAGSDFEKFATAIANIISLSFVKAPNTQLLEVLKGRSQVLANVKNGFLIMIRRRLQSGQPEIKMHAFVEELPVKATGHRVVTPESAIIPGYNSTTIPANHMNMTKFANKTEVGYQRVLGRLIDWVSGIENADDGFKVSITRRATANKSSIQEAMNDLKLGSKSYYRHPKRTSKFVQRPTLISEITKLTTQESETSRVCVLFGMGGQGKTALALDFCRQAETKHLFLAIFWLDASTEDALKKDLIGISNVVKRRADQTFESPKDRISFALQTIEGWNRPWLLILDNYDNPNGFKNIYEYMPQSSQGSILITSRNTKLAPLGTVLEVPPMSKEEALLLLYDRVGGADKFIGEEEHAVKIVELLDYLPLAIDQAGAYIRRRLNFSLSTFIEEYDARKANIWTKAPTVWDYKMPVYTTWEMSFELIDEDENDRTEKGRVLTMLSFLDFRNISQEIFKFPRNLGLIPAIIDFESPKWVQFLLTAGGEWDWVKLEELFLDFEELSLLRLSPFESGGICLSLHPLVSEWMKHRADLETKRQCLLQAIVIVNMCLRAKIEALERPTFSAEIEQQVLRHQFSCSENLRELQKDDSSFLKDLHPFQPPSDHSTVEGTVHETTERIEDLASALAKDLLGVLSEASDRVQDTLYNDQRQLDIAILDWLAPAYGDRRAAYLRKVVEGTGKWFIEEPPFQAWVKGEYRDLWFYGSPGSGKTTIVSQAIEYLIQTQDEALVLYTYCDFRDAGHSRIKHHFGTLLRQTLGEIGAIPDIVKRYFLQSQVSDTPPTLPAIIGLLDITFRSLGKTIFIIIDALDELSSTTERQELLEGLAYLQRSATVRVMVSSRENLNYLLLDWPKIEIKAMMQEDLKAFVLARLTNTRHLARLVKSDERLKTEIVDAVLRRAVENILAFNLIFDELAGATTRRQVLTVLNREHLSLDVTYGNALQRIREQDKEDADFAKAVLTWLVFSRRPPSPRELQHAMAVNLEATEIDEDDLPILDMFITTCAGLVEIDSEVDSVRLTHYTVFEFLTNSSNALFPDAEVKITRVCLKYLSFDPFSSGTCLETNLRDRILEYPFALYAAEFWVHHAKNSEEKNINTITNFIANKKTFDSWIQILSWIEEQAVDDLRSVETPHSETQSKKFAACTTPLEVAKLLQLELVAASLVHRNQGW